ncbi:MAG: molybdenum cofactor biosynthesis protein MoaE [Halobacteria archaeon]
MDLIRIQAGDFDLDETLRALKAPDVGGLVFFVGSVRGVDPAGPLERLEYEAWREEAERSLKKLAGEARAKFGVKRVAIIHRTGALPPGENAVLVAAAAAHRKEAFDACEWLIDTLKVTAPIWKKEVFSSGESRWVRHP